MKPATTLCMPLLATAAALATSCVSLPPSLLDDPRYQAPKPDDFPDDSAVILLQRETFDQSFWPTELTHVTHRIVTILRDEGLSDHGAFFITLSDDETLLDFEATVRTSEGETHTVDRSALIESTVERQHRREDPDESPLEWELTYLHGTLPGVDVGSVVELRYVTRGEYLRAQDIRSPESSIPIKRFERDISLAPQLRFDIRVQNSDVPFEITRTSAGTRIRWALDDLPADRPESWAAAWHRRKPWLLFRTKQVVSGILASRTWNQAVSWSDIDSHRYKKLHIADESEYIFRDLPPAPDVTDCGGRSSCLVERIWAHAHREVRVRGSGSHRIGPLAPVIESGRARSAQVSVWLWSLARSVGLEARLASVQDTDALSSGLDRPMQGVFTHLVVYLPPQGDLESPLWLDPSCPICAPGELPTWSHHRPARVITHVEEDAKGKAKVEQVFAVTGGPVIPSGEQRVVWTLQPGDDPARWRWRRVEEATEQAAISAAHDWDRNDMKRWRYKARALVARKLPGGTLTSMAPGACSAEARRCTWVLEGTMPVIESAQMVRSLELFERYQGDSFESRTRQGPIRVRLGVDRVERLVIAIPDGYRVSSAPRPRQVISPAVDFHLDVQQSAGRITVERRLRRRIGLFPVALYDRIREPVRAYVSARGEAVVLTRQSGNVDGAAPSRRDL